MVTVRELGTQNRVDGLKPLGLLVREESTVVPDVHGI
jgi:hypothetical protein